MDQGIIKVYIEKKINEISKLSRKIDVDFDSELIHDFRVAIKTLRSFLRMVRMANDQSSIKLSRRCKRIYHIVGAIREADMELESLKKDNIALPHYIDKQEKLLIRQKNEWEMYFSKKIFKTLLKKLQSIEYENLEPELAREFVKTRLSNIHELCKIKSPTDNQVHNIRKQLKDVLNTCRMARKNWQIANQVLKDLPLKSFVRLADELGRYNDKRIMLERISSFSSPLMSPDERKAIIELCNEMSLTLKSQKKQILGKVREMIQSLPESFKDVETQIAEG